MPDMIDPTGQVTRVDDVIVSAAVKDFYVFVETEGEGDGPVPGDDQEIEPIEEPQDPDGFMPEPQNCNDVAYLLQEYERKRDQHDATREFLESFDSVADSIDILDTIFISAGIAGISELSQRFTAIRNGLSAAASQLQARLGLANWLVALPYLTLWLATRGTKARWDARIASLEATARDWSCPGYA